MTALMALANVVSAAENENEGSDDRREDRPKISSHPTISGRHGKGGGNDNRPERSGSDQEVKSLVKKFENERESFLQKEKELQKQLKDAAEAQREQIREQQKENLEQWKEQQKKFRDQLRERSETIKNELSDDLKRAVDDAKDKSSGRGRNRQ